MKLPPDWLAQLQAAYPRRDGPQWWVRVRTLLPQSVSAGATWQEILEGTRGYAAYCDRQGLTGTSFVKQASAFYDYRTQGWTEDFAVPEKPKTPRQLAEEAQWAQLRARSAAIGFRGPREVDSLATYETAVRLAEREFEMDRRSSQSPPANNMPNVISMLVKAKTA